MLYGFIIFTVFLLLLLLLDLVEIRFKLAQDTNMEMLLDKKEEKKI